MRSVASLLILSMLLGLDATSEPSSSPSSVDDFDGSEIICQRENGTLDCGEELVSIVTATYGRTDNTTCLHSNEQQNSNTECSVDVTDVVAQTCDGRTWCTLRPNGLANGNPCPMTYKYLNVTYTCDALPLNQMWTQHYTFRFIKFSNDFKTVVQITRKTRDTTCIKEQCLAIDTCLDGEFIITPTKECMTISIWSTADIIVHGMVTSNELITGGFLALPNNYLDTEYLIDVYTPKDAFRPQAAIAAINNNTNVTIYCVTECTTNTEQDSSGYIILNESESVVLETVSEGASLIGTLVRADKAISVVVGSMNVEIPETSSGLDHGVIIEQLMPISKWGHVHVVPPFQNATNGWVVRVTAFYQNTNVNLVECGDNTTQHKMLNITHYVDIEVAKNHTTRSVCMIISDMPVQVMQYMASSKINEFGDPSMTLIPPVQNFHGNTTLRVENGPDVIQYVDFITTQHGKDGLRINGSSVSGLPGYCFNVTDELQGGNDLRYILAKGYCYYHTVLDDGVYHVTQIDQSEKFLVRLYAHTKMVGGAMLADVSFQNITAVPPMDIVTTGATTTKASDIERRASLAAKLQAQGEFKTYGEAEEAMSGLTDYLDGKVELGSVNELDFAFDYFTGVLKRKPLKYATMDNAQSFLRLSSDAINVLFANQTNQLLSDACGQGFSLTSTPEDAERELEGLMNDAATIIIVDGDRPTFGVKTSNAAIAVSSTSLATSSVTATVSSACEGSLDMNGVLIPCEVLEDLDSRATYQINLSYGAEAVAKSSCQKYNETKSIVYSPLLGVGLISEISKQQFISNITLSFVITEFKGEIMNNNTLCSYWDYNTSDWSTYGCFFENIDVTDNGTVVTCLCDHLTSFAVLLNVSLTDTPPGDEFAMEILSWIGCSLSIIACFLMCFGYTILKLHSDLILIHGNLAIAVGVAEVAFLCLDLVEHPSARSIPCTVIAALIYYQLLAMFAWMAIEGIHLYLLTFVVWNAERRKIKYYMACGWGVPVLFLIVLLSVTKGQLGNENVCFLSLDDDYRSLLYFIVPVVIVIVFNLFVMVRVVLQIAKMADGPTLQSDVKSRVRHGVKAILVLLPIMGLTWVFAFLAIERASLAFQYIFVILNSFQGVFIFLVHFIRNSEVRNAFKRRRERWLISHSRQGDYRVKNTKKTTSSAVDKTTSMSKTPDQTLTLMNVHTEPSFGGSISDKSSN